MRTDLESYTFFVKLMSDGKPRTRKEIEQSIENHGFTVSNRKTFYKWFACLSISYPTYTERRGSQTYYSVMTENEEAEEVKEMTNEAATPLTNRERLVKEFNANPDKYLYFYNCVVLNGESDCTNCVIVNSKGNKNCRVAYTEWLNQVGGV